MQSYRKKLNLTFLGITAIVATFLMANINAKPVKAASGQQFTIDYDISYDVQEDGHTLVTQNTTITNQANDVVPTTYSFSTKHTDMYDVTAQVNGKVVEASKTSSSTDGVTETLVNIPIVNFAIGQGRQNKITLKYSTGDIAGKVGNIWNTNIPRINIPDTTVLYNVRLAVPQKFGPKIYLSPTPVIEKTEGTSTAYYFTKESFVDKGITGSFGTFQALNFKLKYQLENTMIIPSLYEIALPPDIKDLQQIRYDQISPAPQNISIDKDGNAMATFRMWPRQKLEVTVVGSARVSGRQISTAFGGKFSELPATLVKEETQAQKYWEVNSPGIQDMAKSLKDPNKNVIENAKKVYDFITKNFSYNYDAIKEDSVQRNGALATLTQKGPWTCMEFTDAFVAISRAMGIPAREINGYAFTTDESNKPLSISLKGGDLLHSWAEFYDPFYGWIQIDPTWGTTSGVDYFTKLDTSHFAFVIKGKSSEYPFPAGSYRYSDDERLVEVDYAQNTNDDIYKPRITIKKVFNFNLYQWIRGNARYSVKNVGGVFIYNLQGKTLAPNQETTIYLPKNSAIVTYTDSNGNIVNTAL